LNSTKVIRALSKLRDRLSHELDATVDPEDKGALYIAIRSLIPDRQIMKQTGHKSVAKLQRYIRDLKILEQNAAARLGMQFRFVRDPPEGSDQIAVCPARRNLT
jgi:hypothetical protein